MAKFLKNLLALGSTSFPERLAEGPIKGPVLRINSNVFGWAGIRNPTVAIPELIQAGTFSLASRMMVKGPGKKNLQSIWTGRVVDFSNKIEFLLHWKY